MRSSIFARRITKDALGKYNAPIELYNRRLTVLLCRRRLILIVGFAVVIFAFEELLEVGKRSHRLVAVHHRVGDRCDGFRLALGPFGLILWRLDSLARTTLAGLARFCLLLSMQLLRRV